MPAYAQSLRQLDDDLWVAESDFKLMGVNFGNRMTVMRTRAGRIVIHSPVRARPALFQAVDALGPLLCIISPNRFHYLHLPAWRAAFPSAPVLAPPTQHKFHFDHRLKNGAIAGTQDEIVAVHLTGVPRLDEFAFIHGPSRTLVLTDLAFNFRGAQDWWTRLALRSYGAYDRFGPTRLVKGLVRDRQAFEGGLSAVLTQDFDRIIVSHGEIVAAQGKEIFQTAFEAFLGQSKLR